MPETYNIKHFFVYVIDRPDDPFLGVKELLTVGRRAQHEVRDIRLSPRSYESVNRVEYSSIRRKLRFLYYRNVFRELHQSLSEALTSCGPSDICVVYFADEGVWAEFWRGFRQTCRHAGKLIGVNVQHGWATRTKVGTIPVRRFVNMFSRSVFGMPCFGMGLLGGVGAGVFEIYLVYTEENAEFVREYTGDRAYSCPGVIKAQLLSSYRRAREYAITQGIDCDNILLALQPHQLPGLKPGTNVAAMLKEWMPIARLLSTQWRRHVVVRRHPGISTEEFATALQQSGMDRYASPDRQSDIGASLAHASVVISYASTVLYEAYLIGAVPVSVRGGLFSRVWDCAHENIDPTQEIAPQLKRLLQPGTAAKYLAPPGLADFDWEATLLCGPKSPSSLTAGTSMEYSCPRA